MWHNVPEFDTAALPRIGDPTAAERGLARWARLGQSPDDAHAPGDAASELERALAVIFGNSPYLGEAALAEPDLVRAVLADGPDRVIEALIEQTAGYAARRPPALHGGAAPAQAQGRARGGARRHPRSVVARAGHRRAQPLRRPRDPPGAEPDPHGSRPARRGRACRRNRSAGVLRHRRARHGQAWRLRAELLERPRPDRPVRAGAAAPPGPRRPDGARRAPDPRPGLSARAAHPAGLRLPGRPQAAAASARPAAGAVDRGRRGILRAPRPELGARGADQGARGRGR